MGVAWKTMREGADRKMVLMTIELYITPLAFKE